MYGRILKWLKQPGESIGRDESLLEISTDKVDTEVPVAEAGVITELLFKEGDTANVGDVIARIETDAANAQVKKNGSAPKTESKQQDKQEDKQGDNKEESKTEAPKQQEKTTEKATEKTEIAPAENKSEASNGEAKSG